MAVFGCGSSLAIVLVVWTVHVTDSFSIPPDDDFQGYTVSSDERPEERIPDRNRQRFAPEPTCNLRVYDADKENDVIRKWHDLIKNPIDEQTAMRQLLIEACDDDEKDLSVMCETFIAAKAAKRCVPGLTTAECVVVTMYTMEHNGFYRKYNNASAYGVWAPYRVFTSLLFSAVKKLAVLEPVPVEASLYRGMSVECSPPSATRIFWKTFTSTSLDPMVAGFFGQSTFFEFQPTATRFGARIRNLSAMSFEDEVLIPPFEVFDFVKADGQKFYFKTSQMQDLHDRAADQLRSAQILTTFTATLISTAIVALRLQ